MQFLLIISHDQVFRPTDQLILDIEAWIRDAEARGVRKLGRPLRPAVEAITIKVRNEQPHISEGSATDAAEQMCAFELIDCASTEVAVNFALAHPMAKAATIEVRPVWGELDSSQVSR